MYVVGLAVELGQLGTQFRTHCAHGVLAEVQHVCIQDTAAIFGHKHQVRPQCCHAVSAAPVAAPICGNGAVSGRS